MLNISKNLLLISAMLEKQGKPTLAHDVESAVERIAELEKERDIRDLEHRDERINELQDFVIQIKKNWEPGKGLIYNISKANESLTEYQDIILKHLTAKTSLVINRIPISYEDTLAGGRSLGKFVLGYAPISAIERTIKPSPQFDKYFPVPKGPEQPVDSQE